MLCQQSFPFFLLDDGWIKSKCLHLPGWKEFKWTFLIHTHWSPFQVLWIAWGWLLLFRNQISFFNWLFFFSWQIIVWWLEDLKVAFRQTIYSEALASFNWVRKVPFQMKTIRTSLEVGFILTSPYFATQIILLYYIVLEFFTLSLL